VGRWLRGRYRGEAVGSLPNRPSGATRDDPLSLPWEGEAIA
jgi:hypothetical protein